MLPKTLRNFGIFVEGFGKVGLVTELEPPKQVIKTEEHRAGGMDIPIDIDIGMEKMEATLKFAEYDLQIFRTAGMVHNNQVQLVARGGAQRQGEAQVHQIKLTMFGGWQELDWGAWKAGDKTEFTAKMSLSYFKHEEDGVVITEIDALGMKRIIGGTDQMQLMREATGYSGL